MFCIGVTDERDFDGMKRTQRHVAGLNKEKRVRLAVEVVITAVVFDCCGACRKSFSRSWLPEDRTP